MTFRDPWLLALALVLPAIAVLRLRRRGRSRPAVVFANTAGLRAAGSGLRARLASVVPPCLRILAGVALAVALARPQVGRAETRILSEGIDIVIAVDRSASMLAEDMTGDGEGGEGRRSRLEAARDVIASFIGGRDSDRIGLVLFAGHAFTQCPLTLDYGILRGFVRLLTCVEPGSPDDGTAIGEGLATAVARLVEARGKSRVVILLTDGRNNRGEIDPGRAADLAAASGIRVYAIGVGTRGKAPFPVVDRFGRRGYTWAPVDIDEETLSTIATRTGGRSFRATDLEALKAIWSEIDRLERTERETPRYLEYEELCGLPLGAAVVLLVLEVVLGGTVFRRLP